MVDRIDNAHATITAMHRRAILTAWACWPAAHLRAQDDEPRPRFKVSTAELQRALAARFPVRLRLAGSLELLVDAPRLLLVPVRQRLQAVLAARLADASTGQETDVGDLDVAFALRYERADRTLRARQLQIVDSRWPGLRPDVAQALRVLLPEIAREAIGEIVLHRFTGGELALPDTLGLEPREITVAADGLVIGFGPKPLR